MDAMLDGAMKSLLPTPMASDGRIDGEGTGSGATFEFRRQLGALRKDAPALATPRATDGQKGGRGDILSQMRGYPSKHAGLTAEKWAAAKWMAGKLAAHGLSGTAALPVTYNWMMGYPPGWLARALISALKAGLLRQASSSKPSATRSSRRFPKPLDAPCSESSAP